jgi:hypothetical protein
MQDNKKIDVSRKQIIHGRSYYYRNIKDKRSFMNRMHTIGIEAIQYELYLQSSFFYMKYSHKFI